MNQIDNTFIKGMNLDLHPSAIPNDTLITCLNGTMKTNNGNEGILQNDLGNVRLTNHSHLPTGYIPLGVKEFGGIMYIASKNPFTGDCQVGSLPSPQQNFDYDDSGFQYNFNNLSEVIDEFLDESTYQVKHLRIIKRLSERITEGTAFNMLYDTEYDTEYKSFPAYIHETSTVANNPEDPDTLSDPEEQTSYTWSLDNNKENALVTFNIAVKNDQGSIQNLESVSASQNDSYNYLKTSGELYLVAELTTPTLNDFYIKGVENQKLIFAYGGDLSDITIGGQTPDDNSKWEKDKSWYAFDIETDIETDTSLNIRITPKFNYRGQDYIIPQLQQEINLDVNDFSTQELSDQSLKQYSTHYNNNNNTLSINWGLVGAANVNKVTFNFYKFNKNDNTFNTDLTRNDKLEITGKRTFNGFFTSQIKSLVSDCLYLVKIVCNYTTGTSYEYYKWASTSDLMVNVGNNKYTLPIYLEFDCDIQSTENLSTNIETNSVTNGVLQFEAIYTKEIQFNCGNINKSYANESRFPVKISDEILEGISLNSELDINADADNRNINFAIGGKGITGIQWDNATVEKSDDGIVTLTSPYQAKSLSKQITKQVVGRCVRPYLSSEEDSNIIFGHHQSGCPAYGLTIGAGTLHKGGSNWCYCYVDMNKRNSNGTNNTHLHQFVYQDEVKYNNTAGSDRKWGSVVDLQLQNWYQNTLKYIPPISFILSPVDDDSGDYRYNGDGWTSELCYIENGDGETTKQYGKFDYSLILWKDASNSYKILRTIFSKNGGYSDLKELFENLYVMGDSVEYTTQSEIVVDTDNCQFTTNNSISQRIIASTNITFDDNNWNDSIVSSIKGCIRNALGSIINPNTDNTIISNLVDESLTITVEYNNISKKLDKEFTLETQNILPHINNYINQAKEYEETSYCLIDNTTVQTLDAQDNQFNSDYIYYKTSENKLAPLNTYTSTSPNQCTKLNDFDLSELKSKVILDEDRIKGKRCIILKSGLGEKETPNKQRSSAHAAPFIGRYMSGNPHHEKEYKGVSGTYPFPLAAYDYGNYKYLCDFKLKTNPGYTLW